MPKEVCWEAIRNPTIKLIFSLYVHCIPMTCSTQKVTMIGTSPAEYFFIRACILFLHNIAPISTLYRIKLLLVQFFHLPIYLKRIPYPIQFWLTAEAVFFAIVFIPLKYALRQSPIYHGSISLECRQKL